MSVNMNGGKPLNKLMMDKSIHKVSFHILLHQSVHKKNLEYFYAVFICEVGKCPQNSGSEAAAPLASES